MRQDIVLQRSKCIAVL